MSTYPISTRHPKELEPDPHHLMGAEPLWHLLHPGRARALLHRCLHRLLHHHAPLPVLPHAGQHARLPAEPPRPHLVPHVLLLWVQRQRPRAQRVLLALHQARLAAAFFWLKVSRLKACQCYFISFYFILYWVFVLHLTVANVLRAFSHGSGHPDDAWDRQGAMMKPHVLDFCQYFQEWIM